MRRAHPKGRRTPSSAIEYPPLKGGPVRLCPEDEGGCGGLLCSACCSLQTHPRDDYAPFRTAPSTKGVARATKGVRQCVNGCVGSMRTKSHCHTCHERLKRQQKVAAP